MANLGIQNPLSAPQQRKLAPQAAPAMAPSAKPAAGLGRDTFTPSAAAAKAPSAAYLKLSAAEQKTFDEIKGTMNAFGQGCFERLLEKGGLISQKDLREGKTLLAQLDRLAKTPLAPELNRKRYISFVIQQIENPGRIQQGIYATCPVTTAQYMLATRAPAEYARLLTDLASGDGSTVLADGTKIQRAAGSLSPDNSARVDPSRLFQAAMMQYGSTFLAYDNQKDAKMLGSVNLASGLSNSETKKVVNSMLNEHYDTVSSVHVLGLSPIGSSRVISKLESMLAKGEHVPVALDWSMEDELLPQAHEVMAIKIENGRFYYRNPQGNYANPGTEIDGRVLFFGGPPRRIEDGFGLESMPVSAMPKRVTSVMYK